MNIAVLGTGSWGTALAKVVADNGHEVVLWGRNREDIDEINQHHTNHKYLPKGMIPPQVQATEDLQRALEHVDMIVMVVPTKAIRTVCQQIKPYLEQMISLPVLVHAAKGLEKETFYRISEMIVEELGQSYPMPVAVLSGPSHAEEVMVEDITTVTAACENIDIAKKVQDAFINHYFRVYTNRDIVGVELGGALKNIIALASGILSGAGYGDNSRAALMTRGLAEITRLGVKLGADPLTFSGLSGVGDLFVTCTSQHSRNFQAGYLLGQGKSLEEVEKTVQMVVEGISTTKVARDLALIHHLDMPITFGLYDLLYQDKTVTETVQNLMDRKRKQEETLDNYE